MISHLVPVLARRFAAAVLAFAFVFAAAAQAPEEDLPARVGRVADFAGELYLAPEERATDWEAIGLNQPITTGDNLWVGAGGRAEIDYGGGQFRLAGDTNVHVSRLDDRTIGLFVAQGSVIVRVRVLDAGDAATIDTPNTQVQLARAGLYRVDVDPNGETTAVVVREGEATIALASGAQQALPGQTARVDGANPASADVQNGVSIDGFDAWSANRDRHYEASRSATYVSRQMVGYADLDRYGEWETSPTYGPVWYPQVVVSDWAPYRFGHWAWVAGFGYAWVDDAPWGYAPFHYGRWMHIGGRWGWCPGQYVARPIWSPALVAWYGGSGWSLSASYGAPVFGWVPLAWGEPFQPWWGRCSHNCWVRYNRPYAVDVAHRPAQPPAYHVNARIPGAITAVAGATVAAGRPVAINRVPVRTEAQPPVLAAAPPVKPMPGSAPAVRPGAGAPPPASALYPAARVRGGLPASADGPSASGTQGTRSAMPPSSRAREYVPPPASATPAPRAVPPALNDQRLRSPQRQEALTVPPAAQGAGVPAARSRDSFNGPPGYAAPPAAARNAPASSAQSDPTARPRSRPDSVAVPPPQAAPAMRVAPVPPPAPQPDSRSRSTSRPEGAIAPAAPTAPVSRAAPVPAPHAVPVPALQPRGGAAMPPPPPPLAQGARQPVAQPPAQADRSPANPRAAPAPQDSPAR